jgi:hypothetical protein
MVCLIILLVEVRTQLFLAPRVLPFFSIAHEYRSFEQLGPSALAGFALFVLIIPLQERIMGQQFRYRRASVKWTDKRAGKVSFCSA